VTGFAAAEELIMAFLNARYIAAERFERRLKKIQALEINNG
jgi:ribose 5-phosphate isomerase B